MLLIIPSADFPALRQLVSQWRMMTHVDVACDPKAHTQPWDDLIGLIGPYDPSKTRWSKFTHVTYPILRRSVTERSIVVTATEVMSLDYLTPAHSYTSIAAEAWWDPLYHMHHYKSSFVTRSLHHLNGKPVPHIRKWTSVPRHIAVRSSLRLIYE